MKKINLIKSLFMPCLVFAAAFPLIILTNTSCDTPQKTIWAQVKGDFQVDTQTSGSITIYSKNGVNLSNVSISSFPIAGLNCDVGTIIGVTKVFAITGTPTQVFNDNILISGDGVNCSIPFEVIAENEYFADGTNWVGHLSGSINYSFDTDHNICHITGNNNYAADETFVIPVSVTRFGVQYTVTTIDDYAFYECSGITNVNFSGVTSIGNSAFEKSTGLAEADITNVSSLGTNWCANCLNLSSVTIGSGTYTTAGGGWVNVGPDNCTLYAPSTIEGNTFKTNIIGEPYADKWTISVNS